MKKALIALVVALCLCTLPVLFAIASPAPATNIKIWPVGTVESEVGPVVTGSPADMMIYVTAYEQRISSAWVLLVINEETYDGLDHVEVAGVDYDPGDFKEIETAFIPLEAAGSEGTDYPGCEDYLTYASGACKDWVGATGEDAYYAIKEVFGPIDDTPVYFTITHYGTSAELRILVLAVGREVETGLEGPFNNRSSFSGGTLIVPELATILLATASLSVFGLYKLKHKK